MFSIHTLVLRLLSFVSLGTLHLIPSALSLESHRSIRNYSRRTECERLEADKVKTSCNEVKVSGTEPIVSVLINDIMTSICISLPVYVFEG